jgi:uncharacterized protein
MSALPRVEPWAGGARLWVRVQPGARRPRVVGVLGEDLKLTVAAPPEDGRANRALVRLLADWLGLEVAKLELLGGHSARRKVVGVALAPAALRARLDERLGKHDR